MLAYRIYWLDHDNRIRRADDLTAATDAEACDAAEARLCSFCQLPVDQQAVPARGDGHRIALLHRPFQDQ